MATEAEALLDRVLDIMEKNAQESQRNLESTYRKSVAAIDAELSELKGAAAGLAEVLKIVGENVRKLPERLADLQEVGEKRLEELRDALDAIAETGSRKLADAVAAGDFGSIGGILKEIGQAVRTAFVDAVLGLKEDIQQALADLIQETIVQPIRDALQNILKEGMDVIKAVVKAGTDLLGEALKGITDTIMSSLQELIGAIGEGVGSLAGSLTADGGILDQLLSAGGDLFGSLGDAFGSLFGTSARAAGGPVGAGRMYLVGEQGPELFVPQIGGTIIANDNLGGRGGGGRALNFSYTIDARGADAGVEARIRHALRESEARTLAAVRGLADRGGSYAKALGRR